MGEMTSDCGPIDTERANKIAAHRFLTELRTRIATQRLAYPHGDEARALESLFELFGHLRDAINDNPGCREFADLAVSAINRDLRPFTAKWHRAALSGALRSRDGGVIFRDELHRVQDNLRALESALYDMAYGEPMPEAAQRSADDEITSRTRPAQPELNPIAYGIVDPEIRQADKINLAESAEISARRKATSGTDQAGPVLGATGLALSGGGIRSASFCLGVVQVLAQKSLIDDVDVLSTVSGGGFTGAFLKLRSAEGGTDPVSGPFGPDPAAVRFLRRRASYLYTQNGAAMGRLLGGLVAGMALNWLMPAALVALVTAFVLAMNRFGVAVPGWLPQGLAAAIAVSGFAFYAAKIRHDRTAAIRGFWIGIVAAIALLALSAIEPLYRAFVGVMDEPQGRLWPLVASAAAALPAISRVMPSFGPDWLRWVAMRAALLLASFAVPVLALVFAFAVYHAADTHGGAVGWLWVFAGSVIVLVLSFRVTDINQTGPHRLYRDRLRDSFVATEGRDGEVPLDDLPSTNASPYLLVNAVANFPASENVGLRERRGDFFLMSKHWCGSPLLGYWSASDWRVSGKKLDLATAIATSGAAVAPHMALHSVRSARALMSFLNLRLGLWIRRPPEDRRADGDYPSSPGPVQLLREMTGRGMTEDGEWLMLTDGAHLDNSGIYELLRRRCQFIVAVDGSADPGNQFDSLMTLFRHATVDFGIRFDVDLDELRRDPATGFNPAHGVLCRLHYPATDTAPAGTGLLLAIKLSITGDEPELVRAYRTAQPAFPDETTADQFFGEHQFEAYRLLGAHAAASLFARPLVPPAPDGGDDPATIRDWLTRLSATIPPPD